MPCWLRLAKCLMYADSLQHAICTNSHRILGWWAAGGIAICCNSWFWFGHWATQVLLTPSYYFAMSVCWQLYDHTSRAEILELEAQLAASREELKELVWQRDCMRSQLQTTSRRASELHQLMRQRDKAFSSVAMPKLEKSNAAVRPTRWLVHMIILIYTH